MSTHRTPAETRRSRLKLVAAVAVVLGAAVAAGGLFYLFGRVTPAAVSLGTASPTATQPSSTASVPAATSSGPTSGDLTGTWVVDPSIGSVSDFTSSFVGYRVQEELVNIGASTAVGRTPDVSGSLVAEGTAITSVEIEADLTTLKSDNDIRDGQLGRQGIETDTYPTATFVLTQPIELGEVPAEGETISATATGDLTLHGVTRSVQIPLQAKLSGGVVTVVGSIDILFSDYDIPLPQSMRVLSIADQGVMELQLHFVHG